MMSRMLLVALTLSLFTPPLPAEPNGIRYSSFKGSTGYLRLETLSDQICHFEYSAKPFVPGSDIWTSPMVQKRSWPGPANGYSEKGRAIETSAFRLEVADNLCLKVEDRTTGYLTTLCPDALGNEVHGLSLDPGTIRHVYGLGQYFYDTGKADESADGDWIGRVWEPGEHGNNMHSFKGKGSPSYAQFPVLYAVGERNLNYALFLDEPYKQRWDFVRNWWRVDIFGERESDLRERRGDRNDPIRGYLITGKDLPALRHAYMDLTGRPPVPPKSVFGLWVSEFGYEAWEQITGEPKPHSGILEGLRRSRFPVDGFALDLQWYGNGFFDPNRRWMGTLDFDPQNFPNATATVASLKKKGVELMLIEQSYIDEHLVHGVKRNGVEHAEYSLMSEGGYLARERQNGQWVNSRIEHNPWWGIGGIIDWTNPRAGATWFEKKRLPLIRMGIHGHWTDLGEPEMYHSESAYLGFPELGKHKHHDIHNLFNLKWLESIQQGYQTHQIKERFYSMSRSGGSGIQRFGAGMWSGDVGAHMNLLRSHFNAKMHMTMAGVDYYSSDIGGFHRWAIDGDPHELYTQWFASGALLDVPVRPHCWNLADAGKHYQSISDKIADKPYETSPDRAGHADSNRENLRLRYELAPYYYSLAHRAHRLGDPIFPPLFYYHQNDPNIRGVGNEVGIGRDLLTGIVASYGETDRNFYLPAGTWFDYYSSEPLTGGRWVPAVPVWRDARFRLPLYARAGALIPKMPVDDATLNIRGLRSDGKPADDLVVRVFPAAEKSQFTLYEDDGVTTGYQSGAVRLTQLSQELSGDRALIIVGGAQGSYSGERKSRGLLIEWVAPQRRVAAVRLNGETLEACRSAREAREMTRPCFIHSGKLVLVSAGSSLVVETKRIELTLGDTVRTTASAYFVCANGATRPGESVFVTGSLPELGGWDLKKSVRLDPFPYPKWTLTLSKLAPNTSFQWRCVKQRESDREVLEWDKGGNHAAQLQASGSQTVGAAF